jgi:hypothetical protein
MRVGGSCRSDPHILLPECRMLHCLLLSYHFLARSYRQKKYKIHEAPRTAFIIFPSRTAGHVQLLPHGNPEAFRIPLTASERHMTLTKVRKKRLREATGVFHG